MLELAKSGICIIFGCGVCCQYLSHGVLMFVMNILWFQTLDITTKTGDKTHQNLRLSSLRDGFVLPTFMDHIPYGRGSQSNR